MPTSKAERTTRDRVLACYRIIMWTQKTYGAQTWFAKELNERIGWSPARATMHAWMDGTSEPHDERVLEVLDELEMEAIAELDARKEGIGP